MPSVGLGRLAIVHLFTGAALWVGAAGLSRAFAQPALPTSLAKVGMIQVECTSTRPMVAGPWITC